MGGAKTWGGGGVGPPSSPAWRPTGCGGRRCGPRRSAHCSSAGRSDDHPVCANELHVVRQRGLGGRLAGQANLPRPPPPPTNPPPVLRAPRGGHRLTHTPPPPTPATAASSPAIRPS